MGNPRKVVAALIFVGLGCGKQSETLRKSTGNDNNSVELDSAALNISDTPLDYRHVAIEIRNLPTYRADCLKWTADITGSSPNKGFQNVKFLNFEGNNVNGKDYGTATGTAIHFAVQTTSRKDRIEFDAARDDLLTVSGTVTDNCKDRKASEWNWTTDTIKINFSAAALAGTPRRLDFVNHRGRISLSVSGNSDSTQLKPFAIALDDEVSFDVSPKISIHWDDAGASSYDVAVGAGPACESPRLSQTGLTTRFARIDPLPVGAYHVCVTARAADGASAVASNNGLGVNVGRYPDGSTVAAAGSLSTAGLYSNIGTASLIAGFRFYEPRYPLWADGASKKRAILIPPGSKIDTTDQSHWVFPVGTVAVKEFAVGSRRLETRILIKTANAVADKKEAWTPRVFVWNEDQTDAAASPDGVMIPAALANGKSYEVPSESKCATCHAGSESYLIGFSGLQLSGASVAVANSFDLSRFVASGYFTTQLTQVFDFTPATAASAALDVQALGYLHGNCGHCHNDSAGAAAKDTKLFFRHDARVATFDLEPTVVTGIASGNGSITPGNPANSRVIRRMDSLRMPPLGVSVEDTAGVAILSDWISKLPH